MNFEYDTDLETPANSTLNLLRKTSYGQTTKYENHDDYGNPAAVTEAAGTSEERTTAYTYNTVFRNRLASV